MECVSEMVSSERSITLDSVPHAGEALVTVYRSITPRDKGNFALDAAIRAGCLVHFSWSLAIASTLLDLPTLRAAAGLVKQSSGFIELLLPRSEDELSATVTTY